MYELRKNSRETIMINPAMITKIIYEAAYISNAKGEKRPTAHIYFAGGDCLEYKNDEAAVHQVLRELDTLVDYASGLVRVDEDVVEFKLDDDTEETKH